MTESNNMRVSGFDLPTLAADNKLNRILTSTLRERSIKDLSTLSNRPNYWQAEYFDLDRVSIFQDATIREQQQILQQLNQSLLQESLYIEQAGVGYMAKMVLMAESTEERMLYSLFAADETTHLAQLQPYVSSSHISSDIVSSKLDDPFLQLLSEIVESSDKNALLFVLQVVLEGWGLTHYRSLAKNCIHRPLRDLFQSFLQAESRHHGAGVILFNQANVSPDSQNAIVECLAMFLQMVRVGPQRVVGAIATAKGHLSRSQRIQILQQLDTAAHSHGRLGLLRSLMASTSHQIVSQLEEKGLFTPLRAEEAA
ncbi:MAG: ferritin-like domain-containing protein, partial [Cyanobacteria bacterium P01_H01_bin.105]